MPIRDNPSMRNLDAQLKVVRALVKMRPVIRPWGKWGGEVAALLDKIPEQERQVREAVELVDRFNTALASRGWVATAELNLDAMRRAIELAEAGDGPGADQALVEYFDRRTIEFGLLRLRQVAAFRPRETLVRQALEDHCAGRYHASVPTILAQVDGLTHDLTGKTFWMANRSKSAHLTARDSIVGAPEGLATLAAAWSTARTTTTDVPLDMPFRHGILHGRDISYATPVVSAKSFALLLALHEWAVRVERGTQHDEPSPIWPNPEAATWDHFKRQWQGLLGLLKDDYERRHRTYQTFTAGDSLTHPRARATDSAAMDEVPQWLSDLTVPDVTAALVSRGFACPTPHWGQTMQLWDCTWSSPVAEYRVSLMGADAAHLREVHADVLNFGQAPIGEVAGGFLGFVATLPYADSDHATARRWVLAQLDAGGETTIGGATFRLAGRERWRNLIIRAVGAE